MSEIVEKSVIGAILIDPKCVSEIYEQIRLEGASWEMKKIDLTKPIKS